MFNSPAKVLSVINELSVRLRDEFGVEPPSIKDITADIMRGDITGSLSRYECLIDPLKQRSPDGAKALEDAINGKIRVKEMIPILLDELQPIHPIEADALSTIIGLDENKYESCEEM